MKFKPGDEVRLVEYQSDGDMPTRYIGRRGIVGMYIDAYPGEPPLYTVFFKGRKDALPIYEDEMELIDE